MAKVNDLQVRSCAILVVVLLLCLDFRTDNQVRFQIRFPISVGLAGSHLTSSRAASQRSTNTPASLSFTCDPFPSLSLTVCVLLSDTTTKNPRVESL